MKKKQYVPEILFLVVLFCFIFLWAVVQPLNVSPDEHMRYQIVEYIMKYGTLPRAEIRRFEMSCGAFPMHFLRSLPI